MSIINIFSGKWLYSTGGAKPDSQMMRFTKVDDETYRLQFMYRFDIDETVVLSFVLNRKEIDFLKHGLESKGIAEVRSVKNDFPFSLELRLGQNKLLYKLNGSGMVWPGNPQTFLMDRYEQIDLVEDD